MKDFNSTLYNCHNLIHLKSGILLETKQKKEKISYHKNAKYKFIKHSINNNVSDFYFYSHHHKTFRKFIQRN